MSEIDDLKAENKKLKAKVTRLEKRLITKAKIEEAYLLNMGSTPDYMRKIREKDLEAMKD